MVCRIRVRAFAFETRIQNIEAIESGRYTGSGNTPHSYPIYVLNREKSAEL